MKKAEQMSDFLEEIGSVSTFMDSQDTPDFEPLPGETRLWGNTDVIISYLMQKQIWQKLSAYEKKQNNCLEMRKTDHHKQNRQQNMKSKDQSPIPEPMQGEKRLCEVMLRLWR